MIHHSKCHLADQDIGLGEDIRQTQKSQFISAVRIFCNKWVRKIWLKIKIFLLKN